MKKIILLSVILIIVTGEIVQINITTYHVKRCTYKSQFSEASIQIHKVKAHVITGQNEPLIHNGSSILPEVTMKKDGSTTALNNTETVNIDSTDVMAVTQ